MGPKTYKNRIVLCCLILSTCLFAQFTWADEAPAEEAPQEQESEAKEAEAKEKPFDINTLIFKAEAELNFSAGIERKNGEIFLIVEMDHNISRNRFILGLEFMQGQPIAVMRESLAYGFANKPVVYLPLIEAPAEAGLNNESVKFLADSSNNRTYQRINLTEVLNGLSSQGRLVDVRTGDLFQAKEIMELSLLVLEAKGENAPMDMSPLRFLLDSLKEGEILQLKGNQPLSDLSERSQFKLGSTVSLEANYKLPKAKEGQHWKPVSVEANGEIVYKLTKNPSKIGESYALPKGLGFEFLPETPKGLMWLSTGEANSVQQFQLIEAYNGLSPNILGRYVMALVQSLEQVTTEAEFNNKIEEFFKKLPFEIEEGRKEQLIERMKTGNIEMFLPLLMREQQASFLKNVVPSQENRSSTRLCKTLFKQ